MNERLLQKRVLETLWKAGKPLKPQEIAAETGLGFSPLMTHLQSLVKIGYVSTPKRGFYAITEHGRETVSITEADRERAPVTLGSVSSEKAFRFYKGINESLGVYAISLNDFRKKINAVDVGSIEFHLFRRDFESWIREGLGDPELANRIGLVRTMGLSGEQLRKRLYATVESRCKELEDLAHKTRRDVLP